MMMQVCNGGFGCFRAGKARGLRINRQITANSRRGRTQPTLSKNETATGGTMGMLTLTAADSHKLGAYRAEPAGKPKGGIVVIQEIFGVNHHIRAVCDRVAEAGYLAVAPALFDRTVKDFQSGYTPDEVAKARKFVEAPDWDAMLRDTDAALKEIKNAGPSAIMGFCMGG